MKFGAEKDSQNGKSINNTFIVIHLSLFVIGCPHLLFINVIYLSLMLLDIHIYYSLMLSVFCLLLMMYFYIDLNLSYYYYIYIYSMWYQNIFRKCYKHQAFIASNYDKLSAKCHVGFLKEQKCNHIYSHTLELPVGCMTWVICYLTPVLKCINHNVTSYLFGYETFNEKQRKGNLHLCNDVVMNPLIFWTLYGFDTKEIKQIQNKFKTRYHVTDNWLENFCDSVIFGGNHLNAFLNDVKSRYLVTARSHYRKIGVKDSELSKLFMKKQSQKLYNPQTMKKIVSMIAFGYIDPINQSIDSIITKSFQYITCGDSSHSIMQILGKQDGV